MRFDAPISRDRPENIVPMINVVFLLLIFFLMTAEIAPPPPVEVAPPEATAETPAEGADVAYLMAGGTLAYGAARGEAALAALAAREAETPLTLRADAGVEAALLAALLPRLVAAGQRIELVTVAR